MKASDNIISILSYNMPLLTDVLVDQIKQLVKIPYTLICFDNGSEKDKIAKSTTHRVEQNTRLTGGMNSILKIAKEYNPKNLWLCTNDIKFEYPDVDPLANMIKHLEENPNIGVLHPSLIKPVPDYCYDYMVKIPGKENFSGITKGHSMVDFVAPFFSKDALDSFNWKLDPRFPSWGSDYFFSYFVRKAGLYIGIDYSILLSHQTSITYDSGNDKEFKNRQEYYKKAGEDMQKGMLEIFKTKDWYKEYFTEGNYRYDI